jgi:integrase
VKPPAPLPIPGGFPTAVARRLLTEPGLPIGHAPDIEAAVAAVAEHTRRAWHNDWALFRAWLLGPAAQQWPDERERLQLPVRAEVMAAFLRAMAAGDDGRPPRAIATVRRYAATLGSLHRLLDLPDPTKRALVRNTLRALARGTRDQQQTAPLRWALVEAALEALPNDLAGLRDRAVLAVAHNSMARRSELVAIDIGDVEDLDDGAGLVALHPSKTDPEAKAHWRFLSPSAMAAVRTWLAAGELTEGPLFVRIRANGRARASNGKRGAARRIMPYGSRLGDAAIPRIIKLAVARVAIARGDLVLSATEPSAQEREMLAHAADYSGHSPRVGAAQDMAAAGIGSAAIMDAGGWSSEIMVRRYTKRLAAEQSGMAQLFRGGAGASGAVDDAAD